MFSCLKKFKALIEKENGYYIKSLRIDRMWVFFNDFNEFVKIMV